jgi:hypothetical protein
MNFANMRQFSWIIRASKWNYHFKTSLILQSLRLK